MYRNRASGSIMFWSLFIIFDQQNALTCVALVEDVPWDSMPRPSHKSNNMFIQTVSFCNIQL